MTGEVIMSFTGTREGLSAQQFVALHNIVQGMRPIAGHHGDCVGADKTFHDVCLEARVPVIVHPPLEHKLRAHVTGAVKTRAPKPYLARNKKLVEEGTMLIACPKERTEPQRARGQGTWSTVRYARSVGRLVVVIWPSGKLSVDLGEVWSSRQ